TFPPGVPLLGDLVGVRVEQRRVDRAREAVGGTLPGERDVVLAPYKRLQVDHVAVLFQEAEREQGEVVNCPAGFRRDDVKVQMRLYGIIQASEFLDTGRHRRARLESRHELGQGHAQGLRNGRDVFEGYISLAPLDPPEIRPIQATPRG